MKEFFKKNWFLVVIAALLVVFVVYYAVTQKSNEKVTKSAKEVDGNYIVYSVGDHSMTADELFESMKTNQGATTAFNTLSRAVIDASVETTEELNQYAASYAQYVLQYSDEETILSTLKSYGYSSIDDLTSYYLTALKQQEMLSQYFVNHFDKYAPGYIKEAKPRKVSHILVKVEDITTSTDANGNISYTANMTDEEKAKLESVKEALKTKSFKEVAKEFSDDSTAENDGYVGIIDTTGNDTYVQAFYDAAISQELGKVSEPVLTDYGYHFILVEEPTYDELKADSTFIGKLMDKFNYAGVVAIKEKMDELGFILHDEKINDLIDQYVEQDNLAVETVNSTESEGAK